MKIPTISITCALLSRCIQSTKAEQQVYNPSPALTSEEEALFAELSNLSSSVRRLVGQPLDDAIKSTQAQISKLEKLEYAIFDSIQERQALQSLEEKLENQTKSVTEAVESYNSKQINDFVSRLQASLDQELLRRNKLKKSLEDGSLQASMSNADVSDGEGWFTMEQLEKEINFDTMTKQPSQKLKMRLTELLANKWNDALKEYTLKFNEKAGEIDEAFSLKESEIVSAGVKGRQKRRSKTCADLQQAVNVVNDAIWKLGHDGENDILRHSSIVYGNEWTSDTYQLGIGGEGTKSSDLTLGDARIRQYIPEDWERLLPSGWQDWDISALEQLVSTPSPQKILPPYVWHSMPPDLVKFLESPFQKAIPAPTEAILNPNPHLGSCWRMAGRNGRVTLRLERPTLLKNITVSHYPWIPSAHNPKEYMRHVSSAPRYMRIIGYPSCKSMKNGYPSLAEEEEHEACMSNLGFDEASPVKYGSFEYKIDLSGLVDEDEMEGDIPTSSVQTFSITPETQTGGDDDDIGFDEDEVESEMGGCSAIKPTCDGAPTEDVPIQAITVIVDENWGHSEYTCMYRIQVDGEEE